MNLDEIEKSKTKKFKKNTVRTKLKAMFKNTPKNLQKTVEPLIDNAAFMAENLELLQEEIALTGWTEEYTNGKNQTGIKVSAAGQAYNNLIKNYNTVIKNLVSLLPDDYNHSKVIDEFTQHINK